MRSALKPLLLLLISSLLLPIHTWAEIPAQDINSVRDLMAQGKETQALTALQKIIENDPDHVEARLLQGVLLAKDGQLGDATRIFQDLIQEHPNIPQAYNNLAAIYASQGRYQQAREILEQSIDNYPGYAIAHENLGDLYASMARNAYFQAMKISGGNSRIQNKLQAVSGFQNNHGNQDTKRMPTREHVLAAQSPATKQGKQTNKLPSAPVELQPRTPKPKPKPKPASPPPQAPAPTAPANPQAKDTKIPAGKCLVIGPVKDQGLRTKVSKWLRKQQATSRLVNRKANVSLILIYYPPLASQAAAREKIKEFKALGVRDMAVMRTGDLANGISLGVYSNKQSVKRRQQDLFNRGIESKTLVRERNRVQPWLHTTPKDESLNIQPLKQKFPGLRMIPVECE